MSERREGRGLGGREGVVDGKKKENVGRQL